MKQSRILSPLTVIIFVSLAALGQLHSVAVDAAAVETKNPTSVCAADDSSEECTNSDAISSDVEKVEDEVECIDEDEMCFSWSKRGECEANPSYMLIHCKRSCKACAYQHHNNIFGVMQAIPSYRGAEVSEIISQSNIYIKQILADEKYNSVINECTNQHASCSEWALDDGCDENPNYMKVRCGPACHSCDFILEQKEKCALAPDSMLDAIKPGEMNQLFERMINAADRMGFEPKVWSRPLKNDDVAASSKGESSCGSDITNPCNTSDGPWVITLENFLNDEEIQTLLDWGARMGYERSQAGDEITEVRTSSHAWCTDECYDDATVKTIRQRIFDVTGVPSNNYECLQLLKYNVGQFYRAHDDAITVHNEQSHGPRLLTFFIYFNEVEKGGGTRFPNLHDMTITPKKGRVLIWPSILDDGSWEPDIRTTHEALEVEAGFKFSANAWIHMRDFQTPFSMGCPG